MTATWRSRFRLPRWTLAGRLLAMQLAIVCVVLVGVAMVSLAQSEARFKDTEGRRALAVAENLAGSSGVRAIAAGESAALGQAQSIVESGRTFSGSSAVLVALADRRVVVSSEGLSARVATYLQQTDSFAGRAWVGTRAGSGEAMATAPIINVATRNTDGVVAVVRDYPSVWDNLRAALPSLLTYLGIASALGVLGSLLLARRVKRQTLGLEPREITGLVEQREAVLHGIREGVLAVDLARRVTMINDGAAHLLGVAQASTGRHVTELDEDGRVAQIFDGPGDQLDRILPIGGRLLTLSRRRVVSHGRHIGWVATLRDRTEMLELQRELDLTKYTTDALRAQAHEFSNRMHVVSGLIALEEYDGVRSYIQQMTADQTSLSTSIAAMVEDPAVAALLIAKSSQAVERGITLVIEPTTEVLRLDESLAVDVNTVIGNLVDNAFDAATDSPEPTVRLEVLQAADEVRVTVRDSGPGVDASVGDSVFTRGFSTKGSDRHTRGIGLALVRVVCRKRGGDVSVHNDGGAVFVASLPARLPAEAT